MTLPETLVDAYRFFFQGAVGFELWSMSDNILFDNLIITDDKLVAEQWAAETFDLKRNLVDKDQVQTLFNVRTTLSG